MEHQTSAELANRHTGRAGVAREGDDVSVGADRDTVLRDIAEEVDGHDATIWIEELN